MVKAEIFEYNCWTAIVDPQTLKQLMERMLQQADFGVVGFMDCHFSPVGYTAVWVIKESHLAIHTFPEEGKTYVQLSSCNKTKHEVFAKLAEKIAIDGKLS